MLTTAELLKKVRKIEIKTRGLSNHIFAGEYHSQFKGRGMSFCEVREYMPGDDVKFIDWNVTARFNTPFIKVFEEERELIVMLLIDISASSLFGTNVRTKRELMTEISAVLAFSAATNNDKIGVIFFSDKIEHYIPPKKGRSHILRIIRQMLSLEPNTQAKTTQVGVALELLNNLVKQRSIAVLMSDFVSEPFEKPLQIAARRHDLVGIHIYDRYDAELPKAGLIQTIDAETGTTQWIDTGNAAIRKKYSAGYQKKLQSTISLFQKAGTSLMNIRTDEDYVKSLKIYFKSR